MVKTESTMLPIGSVAPAFALPNIDGRIVTLDDYSNSPALLVMFICNHCPYVIHVADHLALLGHQYIEKGVGVVAISSNDVSSHPADSPEQMVRETEDRGYAFPYLYDADQSVAKAYHAACTPDFFVFDKEKHLTYRGQLDDSRPQSDIPVTGENLRRALDATLEGKPVPDQQKPSLGCNIKWINGQEPEYFPPNG
jgi:peroxiredoxin